jgi:hypothetical protein
MAYNIEPMNILLLQESKAWVAHCLEFNVAAKGDTPENAQDSLFQVLVAQISLDLIRRRRPLQENRPAPEWYHEAFKHAHRYPTFIPANLPEGFPFLVKEVRTHLARYTTFQQFREQLRFLGCDCGDLPMTWSRTPMVFFERIVEGVLRDCVLKKRRNDEEVTPTEIQAACEKLRIDPIEFNFRFP